MDDILNLSALALSEKLERRELSVQELLRLTLDRIEAVNPAANAIVSLRDRDSLMAEGMVANRSPRRGWLHGIPVAVKDLVATEGIATSYGSPLFADFVPATDDLLARRLRDAGAILIGKTNVPEMGLGSHSYNPVHGVTRNPYDLSRSAGGSSGGAAAALATRMVSIADGSDMMGSLRNPAGWNNVYGHRPTHGLVPGEPAGEMFLHPLATNGPMARCPRDLAALLEVLAGPDDLQPGGAVFEAGDLAADVAGRRIGWLGNWGGAWPVETGILELCEDALRVFEGLGCVVELLAPPASAETLWQSWKVLRHWAVAGKYGVLYDDPEKRGGMKPALLWEIEKGRALSNAEILQAGALRSDWYRQAARMFRDYDAVAMPTAQVWPFPAEWDWPKEIAGQGMDTYHRWMECVVPVSLIGLPCTAIPAGFGANGLPGGFQLAGPRGADRALLQLAEAYHVATDWPGARPPAI